MKSTIISRLLQATVFTYLTTSVLAQTPTASGGTPASTAAGAIETLKCYSSAGNLVQNNTNTFQTGGLCQGTCAGFNQPVMAIVGGTTCYCGSELPPLDTVVSSDNCNSPCGGYGQSSCGGIGYFQLYLTGLGGNVQTLPNTTSSTSSSAQTSATHQATVVVTAAATSQASSGGGPNKVGIAVGVVVGVVALAAIAGGLIFFMRQRRKKEIEEEHKAVAAANALRSDKSSTADSRLDPAAFSDFSRRESIGSIADERDFTRRILQVRNPDRGSLQSVA